MGALSPRTRNAQVELFQSGEVDFLVATDAIGMGLNMDVDHVAFAGLRKFDGRRTRWLHAARDRPDRRARRTAPARRHLRRHRPRRWNWTSDLVEQVVEHRFDPVEAAEWRNARLDFDTLPDLLRSLTVTPGVRGLNLTQPALDETLLRRLIKDEDVARVGRSRGAIMRLWEACQLPDFQKTTLDEHGRLAKEIFQALTGKRGRLTADWIAPRFAELDRDDGQIDQLSARLSGVRTLTYIANRPDWLDQAQGWRDKTKALEERLSDVLHERLTARFVDRRTTALMRALNVTEDAVAEVEADGAVMVEGHAVGRLTGVDFQIDKGSSAPGGPRPAPCGAAGGDARDRAPAGPAGGRYGRRLCGHARRRGAVARRGGGSGHGRRLVHAPGPPTGRSGTDAGARARATAAGGLAGGGGGTGAANRCAG